MDLKYQVFDTEDEKLYLGVESHYWKVSAAKQVYLDSKLEEGKVDDSIYLELARCGEDVVATLAIGVDEAESFALTMLNLCYRTRK